MAKEIHYEIPDWSNKEFTARKNYTCANCGGIITKGTTYLRNVIRRGRHKGVDPLKNIHLHLDCTAPWYHPEMDDRCRNLRQLPSRIPQGEDRVEQAIDASVCVSFTNPTLGQMLWKLPSGAAARLLHARTHDLRIGASAELEQNMMLVAFALLHTIGNKRRGMQVNHALNSVQLSLNRTPKLNHELDPEDLVFDDE